MRKNSLYLLIGFLLVSCAFTSCLDSDGTNYDLTSDAIISAFSIGTIETKVPGKTSAGKDTTFVYTVDGSLYPFTIDQLSNEIYNKDSLPLGTDVSRVVTSITTSYAYALTYLKNGKDTVWTSTDSIDFREPVSFKAYALNGAYRQYQIKINVHQVDPDSLYWNKVDGNFALPAESRQKAVYSNGVMYVFVDSGDGALKVTSSSDGQLWSGLQPISLQKADYTSILSIEDKLYMLADKKMYVSANGVDWNLTNETLYDKMFAASVATRQLFTLIGDDICAVDLDNYAVQTLNKKNEFFPDESLTYSTTHLNTAGNIERLTLVGVRAASSDTTAVVWTKLSTEKAWTYYPQASNNNSGCPRLANLTTIAYDNGLYAFGGANDYATSKGIPAFEYMYKSVDGGIGWIPQTNKVMLPAEFKGRDPYYSYLIDDNHYLWIFWADGSNEVWKGRIGHLGFN